MRIIISGAGGFIGSALSAFLEECGHKIQKLVRRDPNTSAGEIFWDPYNSSVDSGSLEGADAFINLSGENIAQRWNEDAMHRIRQSRIKTAAFLSQTINNLKSPPGVFISASAIGLYGDRPGERIDESSPAGSGFLPELALAWEGAANTAACRVVNLRIAMVLGKHGGALKKMLLPFKLGIGGSFGSGKQGVSWIALSDLCRAVQFCLEEKEIRGAVNLSAPNPVTNKEFTKTLASHLKRPAIFPIPYFAARIILGKMAKELLYSGALVYPEKLKARGFQFEYPDLRSALEAVV